MIVCYGNNDFPMNNYDFVFSLSPSLRNFILFLLLSIMFYFVFLYFFLRPRKKFLHYRQFAEQEEEEARKNRRVFFSKHLFFFGSLIVSFSIKKRLVAQDALSLHNKDRPISGFMTHQGRPSPSSSSDSRLKV